MDPSRSSASGNSPWVRWMGVGEVEKGGGDGGDGLCPYVWTSKGVWGAYFGCPAPCGFYSLLISWFPTNLSSFGIFLFWITS